MPFSRGMRYRLLQKLKINRQLHVSLTGSTLVVSAAGFAITVSLRARVNVFCETYGFR